MDKQYLPGYQLIHEGLFDAYLPTSTTPEEALQQLRSGMNKYLFYPGMGFKVYRRVQRENSVLWNLEEVGEIRYLGEEKYRYIELQSSEEE